MSTEYGDPQIAQDGEILRSTFGSELYGLALPDAASDHDIMGIYIPTAEQVLGFLPYREDYVWRTADPGQRSQDGDTDWISYSLAKYLRLATQGNPTMLMPLFAPEDMLLSINHYGRELRGRREDFLSQRVVHRFLGYMDGQIKRIKGQSKKHVPNRPELIERYGWDTKYGSHALRLCMQGLEIVQTGYLTLPMPEEDRQTCLAVKQGAYSQAAVLGWCEEYGGGFLVCGATQIVTSPRLTCGCGCATMVLTI